MQQSARRRSSRYFDPLTGGEDSSADTPGPGWPFGGGVFYSHVMRRLLVDGVQRVASLTLQLDDDDRATVHRRDDRPDMLLGQRRSPDQRSATHGEARRELGRRTHAAAFRRRRTIPDSIVLDARVGWRMAGTPAGVEISPLDCALALAPAPGGTAALADAAGSFGGLVLPDNAAFGPDGICCCSSIATGGAPVALRSVRPARS